MNEATKSSWIEVNMPWSNPGAYDEWIAATDAEYALLDKLATAGADAELAVEKKLKVLHDKAKSSEFKSSELCRPGVAIETMSVSGEVRRSMIGDCNPASYDAGYLLDEGTVVLRYMDLRSLYTV
jgi:hypothetical protein